MTFPARRALMLALAFFLVRDLQADLVLDLRYSDGSASKTVNSGDHVFVDLLITDTDGSTPLVAEGLLSGGGRLLRSSGTIALGSVATTNPGGVWDGFFDTNPTSSGTGVEIAKVLGASLSSVSATLPTGGPFTTVLIAAFELVATGAPGSTATILADLLDPLSSFNVTAGTFADLDLDPSMTFGSVDLTISAAAVPEPASLALGGMMALGAGGAAWRRRRQLAATRGAV